MSKSLLKDDNQNEKLNTELGIVDAVERNILKYKNGNQVVVPITEIAAGANVTVTRVKDNADQDTDKVIISATSGGSATVDVRGTPREIEVIDAIDEQSNAYKKVLLEQKLRTRDGQITFGGTIVGTIPTDLDNNTLFMHTVQVTE